MMRAVPFAEGEWYHCYNRGVDKRTVFESKSDYARFLSLLIDANRSAPVHTQNLRRGGGIANLESLVDIGAYCLMPNHFHLLLYEKKDGGITRFMHKLGTAYTMYFNIKNERTGNLFYRPFRAKHIDSDFYLQHAVGYIHWNPADLVGPSWKAGAHIDIPATFRSLQEYPYSSLNEMQSGRRIVLGETIYNSIDTTSSSADFAAAVQYFQENAEQLSR